MAKSSGSDGGGADSWPGLLSELTKSFLILRDIFGYALPGAVFLAIGVLSRRFSLSDVQYFLRPYQLPAWLAVILGLAACYTIGHLMAHVAFFFKNSWKLPLLPKKAEVPPDSEKNLPDLLTLREDHPILLTEYDRQTVMTQLRGSTGAAMLIGSLVFYFFPTPPVGVMAGVCGAFLLIVFWFSALPHMDDLELHTRKVGAAAETADKAQPAGNSAQLKQVLAGLIEFAQDALKKL